MCFLTGFCTMDFMEEKFFTSTEAAEITGCSRRQLQYWRERGVVVPTVNATGKGRNVYYAVSDLLALTVMEYLLSIGLNFELCCKALETLRASEPWLFEASVKPKEVKQLMFLSVCSNQQQLELTAFDQKAAFTALCQEQAVVPFRSDKVRSRLIENLKKFRRSLSA